MDNKYQNEPTTRQWIAHILSLLGMDRKAALAATTATEEDLEIYRELIQAIAKNNNEIAEIAEFAGVA